MNVYEAEDRVWTLHLDYIIALQVALYHELPSVKPHIPIQNIMWRWKPTTLNQRLKIIIEWRKKEGLDKKDFNAFMCEVAKQAKIIQEDKTLELNQTRK